RNQYWSYTLLLDNFMALLVQSSNIIQNKILTQWTWIGFYRDGWKWSDNTSVTSIKWSPYEPNNALGNEDCGCLISSVFGGLTSDWFDDAVCSNQYAFFCESRKFNFSNLNPQSWLQFFFFFELSQLTNF
uniref:C-type lectin domain-containing protein n=1 Tax=Astyanax mexicanus TaxID=7994 RepID=A0A8B9RM88_ASTMX